MWILDGQARERAKGRGDRLNRRSTRLEAGKSWNRVGVFAALALGSLLAAACGGAEPEESEERSVVNFIPVRSSHSSRISHMVGTPAVVVTPSPSNSS